MSRHGACCPLLVVALMGASANAAQAAHPDPRLREVTYDARTVITVPVKRGIVALIVFDADESISEVAAGLGGDCVKPEAPWCVAAQPGGRNLFVKAKSTAAAPNNLTVVTDRRVHVFQFVVLANRDARQPVYRLTIKAPAPRSKPTARLVAAGLAALPPLPAAPSHEQIVAERLQAKPQVANSAYSIAEGPGSDDILPALIFDDGRFTYFRFPGNREVPAVFQVLGDGSEALVNARMEDDLLVADRVSRRFMLRAGEAVVGVWNDAFDVDGRPPAGGTTVPGVHRASKSEPAVMPRPDQAGATP